MSALNENDNHIIKAKTKTKNKRKTTSVHYYTPLIDLE